jgi:hypothetical protein
MFQTSTVPTSTVPRRFLPVVSAVLMLRSASCFLEAVVVHSEARAGAAAKWLGGLAAHGSKTLAGLDIIMREVSEVALIMFV